MLCEAATARRQVILGAECQRHPLDLGCLPDGLIILIQPILILGRVGRGIAGESEHDVDTGRSCYSEVHGKAGGAKISRLQRKRIRENSKERVAARSRRSADPQANTQVFRRRVEQVSVLSGGRTGEQKGCSERKKRRRVKRTGESGHMTPKGELKMCYCVKFWKVP